MDPSSSKNSERQNSSIVKNSDWNISVLTNDSMLPSVNSVSQPKPNPRKIRHTQDFNTLNRSSLGNTLEIVQRKKKTKEQKAITFLPKVNADDKENLASDQSFLTHNVETRIALRGTYHFPRDSKLDNHFNSQQAVPYNGAKGESDDEVEIKPRKKKYIYFASEERPIVQSDCTLLKKGSPKTSCERSPIIRHSCTKVSTNPTEKVSGKIEGESNDSEKTCKSVRFLSSPEKFPKRNTFNVETSTMDVYLLPVVDAEGSCKKHISYKKSPHANKVKRLTEKGKNTGGFEHIHLFSNDISMHSSESVDNNSSTEMLSPIYACRQSSRKSSNNCKTTPHTEVSGDQNPLIIGLVTPTQENISLSSNMFTEQLSQKCGNQSSVLKSQNAKEIVLNDNSGMPLGTSGASKRRKWSRSLRTSILDSPGFIHNISPPWGDISGIEYFSSTSKHISCTEEDTPKRNRKSIKKSDEVPQKNVDLNMPPSGTNTRTLLQQKSMLHQVPLNSKPNSTFENKSSHKCVARIKMPNFARIHQRTYEKLENIKEMSERKAIRAKLLLSGLKSEAELTEDFKGKNKKMLKYSPEKNVISTDISIKKSGSKKLLPVPVKGVKRSTSLVVVKPTATTLVPSTSNSKILVKETQKENVKTSHIPRIVRTKTSQDKKETISRFGSKVQDVPSKNPTKTDQVKAVANKSRILTNSLDKRRKVIQNVRSNRRFELLMQMRKK